MKYEFPNDYSKWGGNEGWMMHDLYCRLRSWFIWSNVAWVIVAAYLAFHSILVSLAMGWLTFYITFKLANKDAVITDKPNAK